MQAPPLQTWINSTQQNIEGGEKKKNVKEARYQTELKVLEKLPVARIVQKSGPVL